MDFSFDEKVPMLNFVSVTILWLFLVLWEDKGDWMALRKKDVDRRINRTR